MEEIKQLLQTWKTEKGSFIPNAPIYGMFIKELEDAIERQYQINKLGLNGDGSFSIDEINLCRQYFGFWSDSHSDDDHNDKDWRLGYKLNDKCGLRVANRITENCSITNK
jgi:hypothetical protein